MNLCWEYLIIDFLFLSGWNCWIISKNWGWYCKWLDECIYVGVNDSVYLSFISFIMIIDEDIFIIVLKMVFCIVLKEKENKNRVYEFSLVFWRGESI